METDGEGKYIKEEFGEGKYAEGELQYSEGEYITVGKSFEMLFILKLFIEIYLVA